MLSIHLRVKVNELLCFDLAYPPRFCKCQIFEHVNIHYPVLALIGVEPVCRHRRFNEFW